MNEPSKVTHINMVNLSKTDVATLTALLTLIKNSFDAHPEMYKVLLAVLCDYEPAIAGNKEKVILMPKTISIRIILMLFCIVNTVNFFTNNFKSL